METTGDDHSRDRPASGTPDTADGAATPAAGVADDRQLGAHAPTLLSAEHWSLIASRSLIWSEAQSRATVFLTVLSASIIALALVANGTGLGPQTRMVALVLLPVVFLLGIAAYARLVQINAEEFQLVLAMNRLRRAYLTLEPGLERYLTTSDHDDERGVFATYMVIAPSGARCGSTSWSTPRPSSRRWMRRWPRPWSCWACRPSRRPGPRRWPVGWRRSCSSGGRCSGCRCRPCARSASRQPGSPLRRTDPEHWPAAQVISVRGAGSSASSVASQICSTGPAGCIPSARSPACACFSWCRWAGALSAVRLAAGLSGRSSSR
jgi:hypothetical protein